MAKTPEDRSPIPDRHRKLLAEMVERHTADTQSQERFAEIVGVAWTTVWRNVLKEGGHLTVTSERKIREALTSLGEDVPGPFDPAPADDPDAAEWLAIGEALRQHPELRRTEIIRLRRELFVAAQMGDLANPLPAVTSQASSTGGRPLYLPNTTPPKTKPKGTHR